MGGFTLQHLNMSVCVYSVFHYDSVYVRGNTRLPKTPLINRSGTLGGRRIYMYLDTYLEI